MSVWSEEGGGYDQITAAMVREKVREEGKRVDEYSKGRFGMV